MGKWNRSGVYRKSALNSSNEQENKQGSGEQDQPGIDWNEINLQESRSELSRLETPEGYPKAPSWSLKTEYAHEFTSPLFGADPKMVEAALLGRLGEEEEEPESPLEASWEAMKKEKEAGEEVMASEALAEKAPEEEKPRASTEPLLEAEDFLGEEEPLEEVEEAEEPEELEDLLPGEELESEPEEDELQEEEFLRAALKQEEEEDLAVLNKASAKEDDLQGMKEDKKTEEMLGDEVVWAEEEDDLTPLSVEEEIEADELSGEDELEMAQEDSPVEAKEEVQEEVQEEAEPEDTPQGVLETKPELPEEAEEQDLEGFLDSQEEDSREEEKEEPEDPTMDWLDEDEEWDMQMPILDGVEEEEEDDDFDFFSQDSLFEDEDVPIEAIEVENTFQEPESEKGEVKKQAPEKKESKKEEPEKEQRVEKKAQGEEAGQPIRRERKPQSGKGKSARPVSVKPVATRPREMPQEEVIPAPRKEHNPHGMHMMGFILGIALLVLGTAYAAVSYYFVDHFIPGTTINGISVAGMTAYEAERAIAANVENYSIQIASRNYEVQEISGSSIDYKYLSDGGVLNLMKHQNPISWGIGVLKRTKYNTAKNVTFNKALLRSQLKSLDCARDENQVSPTNAYITMDGNSFSIVPETQGAELKMKEAYRLLDEAITLGEKEIDFNSEAGVYEEATLTADSTAMHNMLDAFNNYATANITLMFGKEKEILDGDTLKNWLKFDEKGELVQDSSIFDQHIWDYVGKLAEKYDTVGTSRPVKATADGRTVYVYGYSYGWQLDQQAEYNQLKSEITQGLVVTREPNFAMRANAYWPNDIGNTYIEVDMGYQHMYYYQNGYMIFDSDFVSGNVTIPGRATPEGIYTLYAKQSPAVLKGEIQENGKPEYETEVSFWMPFNGGVGFHDADWQPYFGYDLYLTNGSHGCINLPYYAAAQLYEIIDYNVPILCFY